MSLDSHEAVLEKHGYKRHGDSSTYSHPNGSHVTLGAGDSPKTRFWMFHNKQGHPTRGFEGETGLHSPRQFEKAIKARHKLEQEIPTQHSEDSSYLNYLKQGGKPVQGGVVR